MICPTTIYYVCCDCELHPPGRLLKCLQNVTKVITSTALQEITWLDVATRLDSHLGNFATILEE